MQLSQSQGAAGPVSTLAPPAARRELGKAEMEPCPGQLSHLHCFELKTQERGCNMAYMSQ